MSNIMTTPKNPTDPGQDFPAPDRKGALDASPKTFNFLSPLNFKFILKRAPNMNYDVHRINIPSMVLPNTYYKTPSLDFPEPGDQPTFAPLVCQFKVDENFNNYVEIFKWLNDLAGLPDSENYKQMARKPYWTGGAPKSEILLTILDSARNVNIVLNFHDAFPTTLTELVFDVQMQDVQYITATVIFAYSYFDIEQVLKSS